MKQSEDEATKPSTKDSDDCKRLTVDWKAYEPYLEDCNLSDEQKQEFLQTLWSIIVAFVDLGFEIHPLQQACQHDMKIGAFIASQLESMLASDQHFIDQLRDPTEGQPDPGQSRGVK